MSNQTMQQAKGIITSIQGQIATIEIEGEIFPQLSEILVASHDNSVILEVFSQSTDTTFVQILSNQKLLFSLGPLSTR